MFFGESVVLLHGHFHDCRLQIVQHDEQMNRGDILVRNDIKVGWIVQNFLLIGWHEVVKIQPVHLKKENVQMK